MEPIDPSFTKQAPQYLWEYDEDILVGKIEDRLNNNVFRIKPGDEMVIQMEDSVKTNNLVRIETDGTRMFVKTPTLKRSFCLEARRWNVVFETEAENIENYLNENGIKLIFPCDYSFTLNGVNYSAKFQTGKDNRDKSYYLIVRTSNGEPVGYRYRYNIPVLKK